MSFDTNFGLPAEANSILLDKIIITDITGKTVVEQTQNTNQVSVEKLTTGVYILNGYSEGNKFQKKYCFEGDGTKNFKDFFFFFGVTIFFWLGLF